MKQRIIDDMKDAMRQRQTERLGVIRMLLAAVKQIEIDSKQAVDDSHIMATIRKMIKQRRDAAQQFTDAGRDELAAKEMSEITHLEVYLPTQLEPAQIEQAVSAAIAELKAESLRDMGKVMAHLQAKLQGQADMSQVSQVVKQQLSTKP